MGPEDRALFEALRDLRSNIAREQGVPPYIIFHDKTLREMAEIRPESLQRMAGISGVGANKLSRYGEEFLDIIRAHPEKRTHNAGPASNYEDQKKLRVVQAEETLRLFLSTHVFQVEKDGDRDFWMTANEAKEYGMIDEVLLRTKDK